LAFIYLHETFFLVLSFAKIANFIRLGICIQIPTQISYKVSK